MEAEGKKICTECKKENMKKGAKILFNMSEEGEIMAFLDNSGNIIAMLRSQTLGAIVLLAENLKLPNLHFLMMRSLFPI